MSRIGRLPVPVPENVSASITGNIVTINGPRGELVKEFHPNMAIHLKDGTITVSRPNDSRMNRELHGLTRALLANMVEGVTEGFEKRLVINGVGYRAERDGEAIVLQVGYSHPVRIEAPEGISFTIEDRGQLIIVEGSDKELVGQIAAQIRAVKKPEPYKGKGIAYEDERIRRKAGKAGRVGLGVGGV